MTKRIELLQMTPRKVFDKAIGDGLGRARALQALGTKPNAEERWFKGRPEYNDPKVKALIREGNLAAHEKALREITDARASSGKTEPITLVAFARTGLVSKEI